MFLLNSRHPLFLTPANRPLENREKHAAPILEHNNSPLSIEEDEMKMINQLFRPTEYKYKIRLTKVRTSSSTHHLQPPPTEAERKKVMIIMKEFFETPPKI
jgi:hypothetical protein